MAVVTRCVTPLCLEALLLIQKVNCGELYFCMGTSPQFAASLTLFASFIEYPVVSTTPAWVPHRAISRTSWPTT